MTLPRTVLRAVSALVPLAVACAPAAVPAPAAAAAAPAPGDPSCAADFDSVQTLVRRDYAGFADKAAGREAALAALTDSVRAGVDVAADPAACLAALRRWTGFFLDRHLWLADSRPQPSTSTGASGTPGEDPDRPSLRFPEDGVAVLRLPDFGQRRKPAIDSLVAAHRARLLATPYLVVDVRGNGGGWNAAYAALIPLLYTQPILVHGMDVWASEGNIATVRAMIASERTLEAIRTQARELLPRMEASPGRFVVMGENTEIRHDTVHPLPKAVAVLVDRRCASTCEQFVLDARQSRKVTVFGAENTGGMLDYGNVRTVTLPSGARRLGVPTARSRRLPDDPMDLTGIAPEVRIPREEADPVAFALRHLRSRVAGRP